jgi:hypothetical protein
MNKKIINKEIKRVKADKTIDAKNKEFLTAWLKKGYDGPDQLLKEEIALRG